MLKSIFLCLGLFFTALSAEDIASKDVIQADDSNFSEVLTNGKCIVNFYSDSDKNSRKFSKIFTKASYKYTKRQIDFIAVDSELGYYTMEKYNVTSIPTVIFFDQGKEIHRTSDEDDFKKRDFEKLIREIF